MIARIMLFAATRREMEFFNTLIGQVLTPGLTIGALTYLCQNFITQLMARDIESVKHKQLVELEQFKKNLDAIQFERQTRFSSVHQKRAEVIASLYGQIAEAHQKLRSMMSPLQFAHQDKTKEEDRKESQRKAAIDAYNALREHFEKHRLYLGSKAAIKVQELLNLMHSAIVDFDMSQGSFGRREIDTKQWVQAWNTISKEASATLSEVEREFHGILGISD
jgi:hypothetical protein